MGYIIKREYQKRMTCLPSSSTELGTDLKLINESIEAFLLLLSFSALGRVLGCVGCRDFQAIDFPVIAFLWDAEIVHGQRPAIIS